MVIKYLRTGIARGVGGGLRMWEEGHGNERGGENETHIVAKRT